MFGQRFDGGVVKAAKGDAVEHAAQHPGNIPDGFLHPKTQIVLGKDFHMGAFVGGGNGKGHAGAAGRFQEDQADVAVGKVLAKDAGALVRLQAQRVVKQIADLGRAEFLQRQATAALKVRPHGSLRRIGKGDRPPMQVRTMLPNQSGPDRQTIG